MTCAPWAVAMPLASMCSSTTGASVLRRLASAVGVPVAGRIAQLDLGTAQFLDSLAQGANALGLGAAACAAAGSPAPWPQMMNSLAIAYSFPPTVTPSRASSHLM